MEEATIRQSKLVGRPEEEVCRRVRARLNQFAAEDRLAGQSDARRETCCNLKTRTRAKTKTTTTKIARRNAILCKLVFSFIIVNNILSNLMHLYHNQAHENYLKLPRIILAGKSPCLSPAAADLIYACRFGPTNTISAPSWLRVCSQPEQRLFIDRSGALLF